MMTRSITTPSSITKTDPAMTATMNEPVYWKATKPA
jgi:hypothetical protein